MEQSENINELAAALAEAQGEMVLAKKTSDNPYFKSKYADLSEVVETLKPVFPKHGLSYIQLPEEAGTLVTQIMHKSGQWIRAKATVVLSKQDPQSVGSAITYMRRYGLIGGSGMATEDDDGNTQIPGRKGGQNPYKVAEAVQTGQSVDIANPVFKYDLVGIREDRKEAAEAYLVENDAVFDDETFIWESKKVLPKLKEYLLKR
jgi:hypothetical protein